MSDTKGPYPTIPVPTNYEPAPPYPSTQQTSGNVPYNPTQQPILTTAQVIVQQPVGFRRMPQGIICPNCKQSVVTRIVYKNGLGTWLICGGICLLGFWCGCQFIPFCVNDFKDVQHFCPNCNVPVGESALIK